jgi:hypothetical protein
VEPGSLGVFAFLEGLSAEQTAELAQRAESWGYTAL